MEFKSLEILENLESLENREELKVGLIKVLSPLIISFN